MQFEPQYCFYSTVTELGRSEEWWSSRSHINVSSTVKAVEPEALRRISFVSALLHITCCSELYFSSVSWVVLPFLQFSSNFLSKRVRRGFRSDLLCIINWCLICFYSTVTEVSSDGAHDPFLNLLFAHFDHSLYSFLQILCSHSKSRWRPERLVETVYDDRYFFVCLAGAEKFATTALSSSWLLWTPISFWWQQTGVSVLSFHPVFPFRLPMCVVESLLSVFWKISFP